MSSVAAALTTRRGLAIVAALVFAGVATVAFYNRPFPGAPAGSGPQQSLSKAVGQTLAAAGNTVASLFQLRSPGERVAGLLANSKKAISPRHERALPKVRKTPGSPLASIVGSPPASAIPPPPDAEAPLYKVVTNAPPTSVPPEGTGGGVPGGVPAISIPGVGGGIVPPVVTTTPPSNPGTPSTPTTPTTPTTPAVPEPSTWAMMLLGFLLIGPSARRARLRNRPVNQAS